MKRRKPHAPEESPADPGPGSPARPARRAGKGPFPRTHQRWEGKGGPKPFQGPKKGFHPRGKRPPIGHKKGRFLTKKELEKREAIEKAERLLAALESQAGRALPAPSRRSYPLDPKASLCPLLRDPETLWGVIFADRVRQRELRSLALRFFGIPLEVETSLEQERLLALRMLDLPEGRRWIAEQEKPSTLVSLHNAIVRLFLQADRSAGDPFYDITQVLRASETKDGGTSRSVLSLERWQTVLMEVPHLRRNDARSVALWACAFAMMQPADADAILGSLIEAGGELFASWLLPGKPGDLAPIPRPSDSRAVEREPESAREKKETETPSASAQVKGTEAVVISSPSDPSSSPAAPVPREEAEPAGSVSGPSPSTVAPGAAEAVEEGLAEAWSRAAEAGSAASAQPAFELLERLRASLDTLMAARRKTIDRVVDRAGRCRFKHGRHPDAAALDPAAIRTEGEAKSSAERLLQWAAEVESRVERIEAEAREASRVREALDPALAPLRRLSKSGRLGGVARDRYARLADRLGLNPPGGMTRQVLDEWSRLGGELVRLEEGMASMAQALPADSERYDDNMRAFLRAVDVLRRWVERRWLAEPPGLDQARRLFDLLALPKFSWQPTVRQLEEEGFTRE